MRTRLGVLLLSIALVFVFVRAQGAPMDRAHVMASYTRIVHATKNGQDITSSLGFTTVKYNVDGTAWAKLTDGTVEHGHWRFTNEQQTQIEVTLGATTTR